MSVERDCVAVVMPCWNLCEITQDAVESILRNRGDYKVRFIFVDNGSMDGTASFLRTVPEAEIITNETNLGIGPGINLGFARMMELEPQPEFYSLICNDVLCGPNFLNPVFPFMREYGEKEWAVSAHQTLGHPFPVGALVLGWKDIIFFEGMARRSAKAARGLREYDYFKQGLGATSIQFFTRKQVELWHPIPKGISNVAASWWEFALPYNDYRLCQLSDSVVYHRGGLSLLRILEVNPQYRGSFSGLVAEEIMPLREARIAYRDNHPCRDTSCSYFQEGVCLSYPACAKWSF